MLGLAIDSLFTSSYPCTIPVLCQEAFDDEQNLCQSTVCNSTYPISELAMAEGHRPGMPQHFSDLKGESDPDITEICNLLESLDPDSKQEDSTDILLQSLHDLDQVRVNISILKVGLENVFKNGLPDFISEDWDWPFVDCSLQKVF